MKEITDSDRLDALADRIHRLEVFEGNQLTTAHAWPAYPQEMQYGLGREWVRELADRLITKRQIVRTPTGTFACPYCGKDTPHSHTPAETQVALEDEDLEAERRADRRRWNPRGEQ